MIFRLLPFSNLTQALEQERQALVWVENLVTHSAQDVARYEALVKAQKRHWWRTLWQRRERAVNEEYLRVHRSQLAEQTALLEVQHMKVREAESQATKRLALATLWAEKRNEWATRLHDHGFARRVGGRRSLAGLVCVSTAVPI